MPGVPRRTQQHDPALFHGSACLPEGHCQRLLTLVIRRVRVCGADECALRFVDRSPARNRRWCSMSRCGNRAKVRLHQARARRSEHTPAD
ncbi:CGNR zinc finger domain-containing protein [Streptomyces collinus]|uniref:CGNR zinc finger domain-containing protein n=1 Tax=Streptomyces TaxID=1883 RepID=UPI0035711E04